MTDVQITFEKDGTSLDYDAKSIKELKFSVEPTRYPPGFSIKKRGLNSESLLDAISQVLFLCG
jgi:transcription-repair coupling factor (superfamily II helicase)